MSAYTDWKYSKTVQETMPSGLTPSELISFHGELAFTAGYIKCKKEMDRLVDEAIEAAHAWKRHSEALQAIKSCPNCGKDINL